MIELFVIIELIDRWIATLLAGKGKFQFVSSELVRFLRQTYDKSSSARNAKTGEKVSGASQEALQQLKSFDFNALVLDLLSQEFPPDDYEILKYVLYRCNIAVNGVTVDGQTFMREVLGRLDLLYHGFDSSHTKAIAQSSSGEELPVGPPKDALLAEETGKKALLVNLCERSSNKEAGTCTLVNDYRERLVEWRSNGIWKETAQSQIYQEYQSSCLGRSYDTLIDLCQHNILALQKEVGDLNQLDACEELILHRFKKGALYFKHATWQADVIRRTGVMLCPELSPSEGVSQRNAKFAHNKYVFGRLEFTDAYWDSRFGDQRICFEITGLNDTISISLHDQAQPFAVSKSSGLGHTQVIEHENVVLREIQGTKSQQQWTQRYNVATKEGEPLKVASSFVEEVFVGQRECRLGLALTLIRELRRMGGTTCCEEAQRSVTDLKAQITKALTEHDDVTFQNIFKNFCRVEIRVPAYIDLRNEVSPIIFYDGQKRKSLVKKLPKPPQLDNCEIERTIGHRILRRCRLSHLMVELYLVPRSGGQQQKSLTNGINIRKAAATILGNICKAFARPQVELTLLGSVLESALEQIKKEIKKDTPPQPFEQLTQLMELLEAYLSAPAPASIGECKCCKAVFAFRNQIQLAPMNGLKRCDACKEDTVVLYANAPTAWLWQQFKELEGQVKKNSL